MEKTVCHVGKNQATNREGRKGLCRELKKVGKKVRKCPGGARKNTQIIVTACRGLVYTRKKREDAPKILNRTKELQRKRQRGVLARHTGNEETSP